MAWYIIVLLIFRIKYMAKKITLNDVASSIEDLAGMVKTGFDEVGKKFDKVEVEIKGLKNDVEHINLKLSNVAYNVDIIELKGRIEILEKKARIRR